MDQVKMTESFAGAMVTVIPIIMLIAGAEYKNYAKKLIADLDRQLQAVGMDDVSDPVPESETDDSPPGRVTLRFKSAGWATLAMTHVLAEAKLIQWLASSHQEPEPGWATYIALTGILGFGITVMLPMLTAQHEVVLKQGLLTRATKLANRSSYTAAQEFSRRHWEQRRAASDESGRQVPE